MSVRVHGLPLERAQAVLALLLEETIEVVPLDQRIAERAAVVRVRRYHRRRSPISLADAILLASAGAGDRIATADPAVLAVAAAEGVETAASPGGG